MDDAAFAKKVQVSLRGHPLEAEVAIPDGSTVRVRIGVPDDSYIRQRDLDTVTVELLDGAGTDDLAAPALGGTHGSGDDCCD